MCKFRLVWDLCSCTYNRNKKACHLSVLSIVKEYYLFKSLLNDAAMVWRNLLTKSHQVFRIYIIHHPFCNYYDIYISKTKQNKKITTQCISIYSPFFSLLLILFYILSDMSMIIHITWLLTTPSSLLLFFPCCFKNWFSKYEIDSQVN